MYFSVNLAEKTSGNFIGTPGLPPVLDALWVKWSNWEVNAQDVSLSYIFNVFVEKKHEFSNRIITILKNLGRGPLQGSENGFRKKDCKQGG